MIFIYKDVHMQMSKGDSRVQCYWLGLSTKLLHSIKKKESLEEYISGFESLEDPKHKGVKIVQRKEDTSSDEEEEEEDDNSHINFVDNLQQHVILQAYKNLLENLQQSIKPLLMPAVLEQPASIFTNPSAPGGATFSPMLLDALQCCLKTPEDILLLLSNHLEMLKKHKIYPAITKQFFVQVFCWMDITLFNMFVRNDHLCTGANGFQVRGRRVQLYYIYILVM